MVDCRPAAGAPPHEMHAQHPHNGASHENHAQNTGSSAGDMGGHPVTSPVSVRASTPANTNTLTTYSGGMNASCPAPSAVGVGGAYACAPYCKPMVWCAPHTHLPPPPPPGVNLQAVRSVQTNGSDLPMNDLATLRYFFNLGLECMWAAYGAPPQVPPRYYSPRDLAQDIQQINLNDRPMVNHTGEQNHKHKQPLTDKPAPNNQGKGNGQRPLLGPRFKRGGNNHDGNQNNYHHQNKGHNNNMSNKGPNNRRNSHTDNRNPPHMGYNTVEGECMMEQPLLTIPYMPYPPPIYPIPYFPVEPDPAMMGMMSIPPGFVGYEEGMEYGAPMQHYYPAPPYPPPHMPPLQHAPHLPQLPPNFPPQPNAQQQQHNPHPQHNSHPQQNPYHSEHK